MVSKTDENVIALAMTTVRSDRSHFEHGLSPAMRALEQVITDIAPTDIPILLVGESGTGKEAVALEIHSRSRRCNEAFFKCNCATLNGDSLPAGFFIGQNGAGGKGAGGTLLLDEISQLEFANQDRLLHLLPDGDRIPPQHCLGARVISATTRHLEDDMRSGRFREELYYRINGVCLRLPSLRHRGEDIPVLLAFFLKKYASLFDRQVPQVSKTGMDLLLQHSWPGNIRELENLARKLVVLGEEQLALSDLFAGTVAAVAGPAAKPVASASWGNGKSLKEASR